VSPAATIIPPHAKRWELRQWKRNDRGDPTMLTLFPAATQPTLFTVPQPAAPLLHALRGVEIEARDYQQRIITKACEMFAGTHRDRRGEVEPPATSILIESPTGSGKTVMGLAIARQMQHVYGYRIGWVAMRRNLLAQAARENSERGFHIDMLTISMFEKNPPHVDMLVIDEAQHDGAMSMANLHSLIKPKVILGLTATPFRTDRVRLCFDKVIKDCGIHRLIQDGYLSRYHHYTLPQYSPQSVAQFYLREPQRWGKSLVFFHRQEQCDECLKRLTDDGIRADVVTGKSNRERQLDDFCAGRTDVLINMNVLTEGFDCPQLQTVFCRPSGRACTIQMAGRVFRQHAATPLKQVVQCKATRHPMVKTALADQQFVWNGTEWQTLQVNERIEAITELSRKLIARGRVELPELVAAHRPRPNHWQRNRVEQ
jgi:superfamily II DNA or RNA helicase